MKINETFCHKKRRPTGRLLKWKALLLLLSVQFSAGFASASASYSEQTYLSIEANNMTVKKVFELIEKKSEYIFFYVDKYVDLSRKVNIDVKEERIETILDKLFANTDHTYSINDRQIVISKKEADAPAQQQTRRVTGIVMDSKGESVVGATVMVKGTTIGVTTDAEGRYEIRVPDKNSILTVSYLGYTPEDVKVNGRTNINVVMHEDLKLVDEVVVIGYGQQKKESVVVSMSSVKSAELQAPTRNLMSNIAGQVSGLIAVQRSGEPGYDNAEFWIRGISSFGGGNSPLVLVDGVPRNMADIETDEIETFSVLKDAAATAIYGAEGANGVILITTKRGRDEKPKITFRTEHSVSSPQRLPRFVNSAQHLELFNEALRNDGEPALFSDEYIDNFRNSTDRDLYPDTDWISELLRKRTHNHRYTLNVRGGSAKAKYFVSGAYFNESGIYKGNPTQQYDTNIGLSRYNLRSNIDMKVTSTTDVSVDLAGQYMLTNYPGKSSATIFRSMLITPPYTFPAVYSDGTVATYEQERGANMRNPYNELMNSGYTKEWRTGIQSKVAIKQQLGFITQGLTAKLTISYDYDALFKSSRTYNPSRYHATGRDENGALQFIQVVSGTPDLSDPNESNTAVKKIYIDASVNYKRTFAMKHETSAMLLYMQKETQNHNEALAFRKQGFVGRVTYGYDSRYFVEGNFGYTGSETFAKNYRFGFFPAVGFAYYLSNEPFFPEKVRNYVDKLKIRLSYGRTGNDNTGGNRFLYRPTFTMNAGGWNQGINDNGGTNGLGNGIVEGRPEALQLGWEIEDKQNYGFELGMFGNKLDLVFDYFTSERSRILMQRKTISQIGGFRVNPWENFGKVSKHGVDMSLNARHSFGDLSLSARGTFTLAKNKITEYDELTPRYPWMAQTGQSIGVNTLYIAERLYTRDDFFVSTNSYGIETYTLRPELPQPTLGGIIGPGDIKYRDVNGDGVVDSYDRVTGVGHPKNPEIVYGFGLNAEYKGFYASVFFQGTGNTSVLLGGDTSEGWFPFAWGVDQTGYRSFALDRWTEADPRQDVLMPRLHKSNANNANNTVGSTWWLRNGGFLRLKNVEFGYQLPRKVLQQLRVRAARLYVMGYNLACWDDIQFFDPESGNANAGNNYPKSRTFTVGLEVTF